MNVVVVSDVHDSVAHAGALRRACEGAGALIVCGDFTTFGGADEVQRVADALRPEGVPCYFITGNCDAVPADVALAGCHNLHGRVVRLGPWLLAGVCGSLPCPAPTPREFKETFYAQTLASVRAEWGAQAERLVIVSHQPPFGTAADLLPAGRHVGCHALRAFIDEVQPAFCFTGHIHEAASRTRVGRTLLLNPGPFAKGRFAVVDLAEAAGA